MTKSLSEMTQINENTDENNEMERLKQENTKLKYRVCHILANRT